MLSRDRFVEMMPKGKSKISGYFFPFAQMEEQMRFVHSKAVHRLIQLLWKRMSKSNYNCQDDNMCNIHTNNNKYQYLLIEGGVRDKFICFLYFISLKLKFILCLKGGNPFPLLIEVYIEGSVTVNWFYLVCFIKWWLVSLLLYNYSSLSGNITFFIAIELSWSASFLL